jgi:apolipoprotein N-acyltransferase
MLKRTDIILAIISGILLVLGFPPFDFYLLAWIALVPLLISLYKKEIKTSFLLGILTGFVYFLGTIYWIFHSVYFYGNIPLILSLILLVLLCLYLGAYVGVFSIFFNLLSKHSRLPALFIVPVLWVTLEFLRTYALTGFPWALLGYSQYKFLLLIQIADITGVYGISFLVAALNGAIFDVAVYWPKRLNEMPLFARWPMTISIIIYTVIIMISLSYGMWRLKIDENEQRIKVSVVQGNIKQEKKWDPRFQKEVIDTYKRLSIKVAEGAPDIIVWPETALPFAFGHDEELTKEFLAFQRQLGIPLLFGSVVVKDVEADKPLLSNSAVLLSPEGEVLSIYDKIHLVPYGEYIPLRRFFPYIKKLVTAIGDFKSGKEHTIMETPFARIGNLICYEIIFPGLVRKFVDKGANVLVTITNDAWFGRTSAPYQHFTMAVFRAVENRVPVIRAANTGISGFIDAKGRIKRKSDIFVEATLTEELSVGSKKSFYTKFGDLFAFLCIISSVLLIVNRLYPERRRI